MGRVFHPSCFYSLLINTSVVSDKKIIRSILILFHDILVNT